MKTSVNGAYVLEYLTNDVGLLYSVGCCIAVRLTVWCELAQHF